jgi:hypothetical protein
VVAQQNEVPADHVECQRLAVFFAGLVAQSMGLSDMIQSLVKVFLPFQQVLGIGARRRAFVVFAYGCGRPARAGAP